jgi:hypothetical protein
MHRQSTKLAEEGMGVAIAQNRNERSKINSLRESIDAVLRYKVL